MSANVWVIGAGGLLGSAVLRSLEARRQNAYTAAVAWGEESVSQQLHESLGQFFEQIDPTQPWQLLWCAGSGVTGTPKAQFDIEVEVLGRFLADVSALAPRTDGHANGLVFYASSVGGLYGGCTSPPFSEFTPPNPISPYGMAKLISENVIADFTESSGIPSFIGRLSNLYGPGQNLAKPQGLISVLIKNYLQRVPTKIYVSLDTLRDYIFVDDASEMIVDAVNALSRRAANKKYCLTKIIASQRSDTIGSLIAACQMTFKIRPNIVLGASPLAAMQGHDLRVRSKVWPELDHRPVTSLPIGMAATLRDMRLKLQKSGSL